MTVWVFKDKNEKWVVFNQADQEALNKALMENICGVIQVRGGRADAHLADRFMRTVYDAEPCEMKIQRSAWFLDNQPFAESESDAISEWFAQESSSTTPLMLGGVRKIYKSTDNAVHAAGQTLLSVARTLDHFSDPAWTVPETHHDDPAVPCTHLIISVHGIGESLWSRKAFNLQPFEVNCGKLRSLVSDLKNSDEARTEVLHVNWFHILADSVYTKRIADITLPTIPVFRQIANEAIADVIFYLNPEHREAIVSHVAGRIVEIALKFKERNPSFSDRVSLIGHSLGSVICYDVLSLKKIPPEINFDNIFLCGSPLGMFLTARGQADALPLKQCGRVFNLIQPNDPVAYRIEPFLVPVMKTTDAALIPYHKTGGLAATTQVRHTASSIMGLFAGDKESTFTERITQVVKGPMSPKPESPLGMGIGLVEAMNGGQRVDWIVQHGFMPGGTEYADALTAHVNYFDNKDIAKFVHERTRM